MRRGRVDGAEGTRRRAGALITGRAGALITGRRVDDAIAAAPVKERTLEQTGGIVALLRSQHLTHMATFFAQVQSWRKSMMPT